MDPEGNPVLKKVISEVGDGVVASGQDTPDRLYSQLAIRSKKAESPADTENRDIIRMRRMWSVAILLLIIVIVAFDIILVWQYGRGKWKFDDSKVVIAVITENFLKIFTLGYIITGNLFKKIFDMNQDSTVRNHAEP